MGFVVPGRPVELDFQTLNHAVRVHGHLPFAMHGHVIEGHEERLGLVMLDDLPQAEQTLTVPPSRRVLKGIAVNHLPLCDNNAMRGSLAVRVHVFQKNCTPAFGLDEQTAALSARRCL